VLMGQVLRVQCANLSVAFRATNSMAGCMRDAIFAVGYGLQKTFWGKRR
jgi:hypothetical protein